MHVPFKGAKSLGGLGRGQTKIKEVIYSTHARMALRGGFLKIVSVGTKTGFYGVGARKPVFTPA